MKNAKTLLIVAALLLVALLAVGVVCEETIVEQVVEPETADAPFRDQKDKARIETCVGPCLSKYPQAMEFIMKYSWSYSGLQTLFNGEYPQLIIYDTNGNTIQSYDLREKKVEEIEELMKKHGVEKVETK